MTATGKISLDQLAKDITECKKVIQRVCLPILEEAELFINEVNEPLGVELIQGYTAEQWQIIIDGGYLCEFSNGPTFTHGVSGVLFSHGYDIDERADYFCQEKDKTNEYNFCRPAQIKGVMRPIFVEPVDNVMCAFFSKRGSWVDSIGWRNRGNSNHISTATKYIEL